MEYATIVQTAASFPAAHKDRVRLVPALESLRRQLSLLSEPDPKLLLRCAGLLMQLGRDEEALCVAERAQSLDPADPDAMLTLCGLDASRGDDLARQVLASPFATPPQRQAALAHIDPAHLPAALRCTLPATERLTLLQRADQHIALRGLEDGDFPNALGRTGQSGCSVVATDYFLRRPCAAPRQIQLEIASAERILTIEPLLAPPAVVTRAQAARLWVIVPLKDGGKVLATCLESLRVAMTAMSGVQVILVDDQSEKAETRCLLSDFATVPGVTVLRSDRPLGFTGAVNLGLAQMGEGPVLLLNSDTYLPPDTLERLLVHLADPTVGTVTPLTNNGGSFSIPQPRTAHAMPDRSTCDRIARTAYALHCGVSVDVLNGNGFAMLISADCLRRTGPLSQHYTSGYYEEVDFCLRASDHGFRHVAAVDCFVGHVGSVSYGAEKHRLVAENRRRLYARFPTYAKAYARYGLLDPIATYRARLMAAVDWMPEVPARDVVTIDAADGDAAVEGALLLTKGMRRHAGPV